MNIPINKDIEEAYKSEFVKGFTIREFAHVVMAVVVVAAISLFCWLKIGIAVNVAIYIGLPFAAPIILLGFYKPYGMYVTTYLKELSWERKTRVLLYDAMEASEDDNVFTMKSNGSNQIFSGAGFGCKQSKQRRKKK